MEKLLNEAMKNPTLANKAKLAQYENDHPMAICFLTKEQVTILNQYKREAA